MLGEGWGAEGLQLVLILHKVKVKKFENMLDA